MRRKLSAMYRDGFAKDMGVSEEELTKAKENSELIFYPDDERKEVRGGFTLRFFSQRYGETVTVILPCPLFERIDEEEE